MSISRAQAGSRRGGLQRVMCGLGHHAFERLGARSEMKHRYSEVHETMYEVTQRYALLKCPCCGHETVKLENTEELPVGHYERVYVKA